VSNGFADVTVFVMNGIKWTVISKSYLNPENDWMKMNAERITPEQAIAVTLGSESVDYMLNTIGKLEEENERLRSSCGTLTAEQVSEAIEKCFDFDVWVPSERGQAIADELNATLGRGECEPTKERTCKRIVKGKKYGSDKLVCSECGYGLGDNRWSFCPKCGAKVVGD